VERGGKWKERRREGRGRIQRSYGKDTLECDALLGAKLFALLRCHCHSSQISKIVSSFRAEEEREE